MREAASLRQVPADQLRTVVQQILKHAKFCRVGRLEKTKKNNQLAVWVVQQDTSQLAEDFIKFVSEFS
jgi:hypothetical protein